MTRFVEFRRGFKTEYRDTPFNFVATTPDRLEWSDGDVWTRELQAPQTGAYKQLSHGVERVAAVFTETNEWGLTAVTDAAAKLREQVVGIVGADRQCTISGNLPGAQQAGSWTSVATETTEKLRSQTEALFGHLKLGSLVRGADSDTAECQSTQPPEEQKPSPTVSSSFSPQGLASPRDRAQAGERLQPLSLDSPPSNLQRPSPGPTRPQPRLRGPIEARSPTQDVRWTQQREQQHVHHQTHEQSPQQHVHHQAHDESQHQAQQSVNERQEERPEAQL